MSFILQPWQLLFAILSGWIHHRQQLIIEFQNAEILSLMESQGKKRILLNDDQRRLLAVKGKALGRRALRELTTIVTPDTILRWHRELVAQKWDHSAKRNAVGRPRIHYHDFGEIGTAALLMMANTNGIKLSRTAAEDAMQPLLSLPPRSDVRPALETLSRHGYQIVSLTNSSKKGVETQFRNAELTDYFERSYSVEDIKKYKPHPATYQMVLDDLGVQPDEVLMVAAHAWDLMGAKNVGLKTAFVARPSKTLYPNVSNAQNEELRNI